MTPATAAQTGLRIGSLVFFGGLALAWWEMLATGAVIIAVSGLMRAVDDL